MPVDVVVLTVIPAELEAARLALGLAGTPAQREAGADLFHGTFRSARAEREARVVLSCIGAAGNAGAAAATAKLVERLRPAADVKTPW